jgi:hypothetical protein
MWRIWPLLLVRFGWTIFQAQGARHGVCANKSWDLMEVLVRAVAIFNDRLLLCGGYFQGYVVIVG